MPGIQHKAVSDNIQDSNDYNFSKNAMRYIMLSHK